MGTNRAILLMAYGSPNRPEEVAPYYTHIRGGRKPSAEEVENLKQRYSDIGGKSPLLDITLSTAKKLESSLGGEFRVYAGMKHWHPYISEVFDQISKDGITELIAIALAPHYSKMSVGSYQEAVRAANVAHGEGVKEFLVNQWYDNQLFLASWTRRIEKRIREKFDDVPRGEVFVLFTAHSLPERILTWADPYKNQLLETAEQIAKRLSLKSDQFSFAFQSAGHTSEPWLGPDILVKLRDLSNSGRKQILVAPIGFVSDHLEILYDIDIEAMALSHELGFHLERTELFNDSDDFVNILSSVVKSHTK
jgi:protoporphyrin/coproporphyrin ferrochelatase